MTPTETTRSTDDLELEQYLRGFVAPLWLVVSLATGLLLLA